MTKRRSKRSSSGFDWRAILSDPTFRDVVQQAMAVIVVVVGLITLPAHAEFIGGDQIEGWVKLEFTVLEDGSVGDVKVLEAEPGRIFNSAATRAILRWRFKPKVVDGKPVQRRATQTIDFKLDQ